MESIDSIKTILNRIKNNRRIFIKIIVAASATYASHKLFQFYIYRTRKSTTSRNAISNKNSNRSEKFESSTNTLISFPAKSIVRRLLRPADRQFLKQLRRLLKIMIPGLFTKEAGILFMHSVILFVRTFTTIYVASIEGGMTKSIVRVDTRSFVWHLIKFLFIAVPATFMNSMIRYFESCLGMAFRTRLVEYSYKKYFTNETYYRVSMLDGRLMNADQCLTEDMAVFTSMAARLYSQLTKPLLDIALICATLWRYARGHDVNMVISPVVAIVTVFFTFSILKAVTPRFGRLVAEEAKRKGFVRYVHGRLITNSEEIAFYGGDQVEHSQLKQAYRNLCNQMSLIYRKRISYVMMEQFFLKYVWTAAGMVMIAAPALTVARERVKASGEDGYGERAYGISVGKNLLGSAADALERLMSSYKDISELGGYVSRVSEMLDVFDEVAKGKYKRTALPSPPQAKLDSTKRWDISRIEGHVIEQADVISLEDVPIVTPTGEVVVESLSFEVRPGMHLLISGPNGCGKSSLFRILGGLWPVYHGKLHKPTASALFYIPQRPYMSLGTLRDQVIYPDSREHMVEKGYKDEDLDEVLSVVHLSYVVEREGGWNSRNDWMDVLSGGEKQRIGLARIFYHRPTFAILDECTSAISIDVEGLIYQAAKGIGVTLLTVTHRPSLWKYHTHILQFDGTGNWSFGVLDGTLEQRLSLAEEKQRLESKLSDVPQIRARLRDVCTALGDDSTELQD